MNKEVLANKTREDAKPIDCSKYVDSGTGNTATNSNLYSVAIKCENKNLKKFYPKEYEQKLKK